MTIDEPTDPPLVRSAMRIFDLSLGADAVVAAVGLPGAARRRARCCSLSASARSSRWADVGLPRINGDAVGGPALFGLMIWLLYIRFIVPVLGVFYGTALIADEVEDKTITYLFTRPIPRRRRAAREVPGLSRLHDRCCAARRW